MILDKYKRGVSMKKKVIISKQELIDKLEDTYISSMYNEPTKLCICDGMLNRYYGDVLIQYKSKQVCMSSSGSWTKRLDKSLNTWLNNRYTDDLIEVVKKLYDKYDVTWTQ
jgi:hypothetical protein